MYQAIHPLTNQPPQQPSHLLSIPLCVRIMMFNTPTHQPTTTTTLSPTLNPTVCADYDVQYNSSDADNELNVNDLANSVDFAYDASVVIRLTHIAEKASETIYLNASTLELQCFGVVTCFETHIVCSSDQPACNILCAGYLSCAEAIIHANHTQHVHVICNGNDACSSVQIYANRSNQVTVDCVASTDCQSMQIHLDHNAYNVISCYLSNACDDIH
eukprot:924843_1